MNLKITINHDETEAVSGTESGAKSAVGIGLYQTHGAVGFAGIRTAHVLLLPGQSHSFDLENGSYLRVDDAGAVTDPEEAQAAIDAPATGEAQGNP